jgi:hypothetical protein
MMAAAARDRDPAGGPGDRPGRAETDDRPGRTRTRTAGATLPARTFRRRKPPRSYWRNAFNPPPAGFDGSHPGVSSRIAIRKSTSNKYMYNVRHNRPQREFSSAAYCRR